MQILIRKHTAKPRFHPHYNRTTERYYGSEREYTSDIKNRGLEPYVPGNSKNRTERKPYKASQWARDMINDGIGKNGKVGDVWKKEIMKKNGANDKTAIAFQDALPEVYRK